VSKLVTPFGFGSTTSGVLRGIDLSGKTALVTGANSGIGHETARALASAGAAVVVAARRDRAGRDAAAQIAASTGNPHVSHFVLDLADLESVARAAAGWSGPLHILVNKAGIMAVPELTRTAHGHELQFATNYLGHFALGNGPSGPRGTCREMRKVFPGNAENNWRNRGTIPIAWKHA
jgi:NAD(P)-dependent dehydrogenase (short-subunit alcohol dehydrogenase family)